MMQRPSYLLIFAMMAALAAIAITAVVVWRMLEPAANVGAVTSTTLQTAARIGGPFTLTDQTGKTVSSTDFGNNFKLIYFGYGYCPDVCPTELQNMSRAIDDMGAEGKYVTPIFITVDPERDNAAFLASYVTNFHPRLVGLTGTPEQIAKVAREYRVSYEKVESDSSSDYLVNHTSFVYLTGPKDDFVTMFRSATDPQKMAAAITKYIEAAKNP